MNLQVCVPYEKCPFNCPCCIANGRKRFDNLYESNKELYLEKLKKEKNKYDNFILTGDTEPTLNSHWLKDVLQVLSEEKIELQTKNYNLKNYNLKWLTTLSYSILSVKDYLNAWRYRKIKGDNRLVILLTKDFAFLNEKNFSTMGYNQITFKVLQLGNQEKTNKWVEENKMTNLENIYKIIERYNGSETSVRIDTNCQNSEGRYEIFRSDGYIYKKWEDE